MNFTTQVKVNPKVLVWAREEKGFTKDEAASHLNIDAALLGKWEADGEAVPFNVLQQIAKAYKLHTGAFFLPDVPPKTKKIKDCRNLAKGNGRFSPDTLLAIRRTSRYLEVARDISDGSHWSNQYKWIGEFNGKKANVEQEVKRLRDILDAPLDEQFKQNRADEAFRFWRKRIEDKLGIFVFQFAMPEKELDGFSYAFEALPYAIVVNNKQVSVRKIFTLFHEVAHILKRNPGICRMGDALAASTGADIELECNNFAGKLLVPTESLVITTSVDKIFELGSQFNVSGEVYLRRLFEEKKIKRDTFFNLLEKVRERSDSFPRKKKEGSPSMVIQSKSTRGNAFFRLVVDAAVSNKISFSAASDLLGLKPGNIR